MTSIRGGAAPLHGNGHKRLKYKRVGAIPLYTIFEVIGRGIILSSNRYKRGGGTLVLGVTKVGHR